MLEIISYIASGLIVALTPILFAKIILRKNIKLKRMLTVIIILISTTIIIITQLYLNGIIKTIIHCLIYILELKIIYKLDYWKIILLVFIYLSFLIIIEGITFITTIYLFNINKFSLYYSYAGTIIINIIIYNLSLICAYYLKNHIKKIINYKLNTNKKLAILSLLTLICILYLFYKAFDDINPNINFYMNIGTIIAFIYILYTLINQIIINNNQTIEYDKLLDFMKIYEIEIENQRINRHETKNQLLTIKSKIYDKEKDIKVINYIDSILDEKIEVSQEHYAKFQYLPANGLKALFYFKTREAEDKGIKVSINISKRIENSLLYNLTTNEFKQLGRLIGIYLDNAIEASESSEDKIIGIEIYVISNNVEIIISNSYINSEKKISNNGKSTKGKNRGHGLIFANNILNGTNKFESTTNITDKLYIQKLIIKKSTH